MRRSVLLVCMLAAGCTAGPDYVKPGVVTPEQFRFQDQEARDTVNTPWWKQFEDPVLDALIEEALAHNKNVQVAAANVEEATAVLTQTRSQFFPQVGYQASAARQRGSESGLSPLAQRLVDNPANTYEVVASASWEIDLWGRIRRQTEAARANVLAVEQARRGVILSLVAQVASAYLQLRGLDSQLDIANKTLAAYGETLKLFELRFKYGQISQMNVEQARSRYETAATQIPQLRTGIAQTENALSVLLGRNPGSITRGKSIQALAMPAVPAGIPSEVLARRPDLAQAEQQLVAANAQIGAARALYFPTISLTGALGTSSSDLRDLFSGPSRLWSYGGSLTGPIFRGGAIRGQVRQTEAARKAALLAYEAAIQNAFADVDNALVSHQQIVLQLAAQERLVKALSEYERLANLQYEGGYTPYSTVLQAQQELFPQQLSLAQNRYAVYNALVTLYKVMGGGWVDIAQKQADIPMQQPTAKANEPAPAPVAAKAQRDRIEVNAAGEASVVNVFHVVGIGDAQMKAPASGWPSVVLVRLHGFPELESFVADAGNARLDCVISRPEKRAPVHRCKIGGNSVDAMTRTGEYFEVKLPPVLLTAQGNPVDLHWVDQWR
jgi:outer membrane protein, multidrug efflux system